MFTPMEFHPTLSEVEQANRLFWDYMKREWECIMLPENEPAHMSLDLAVRCAAANVWKHARMYQAEKAKEEDKNLDIGANIFRRFDCMRKYTTKFKTKRKN